MQFPRSTIQSLSETFEFDHASSSNNSGMNQQLFWNSVLNPVETRNMQEYLRSPSGTTNAYANTVNQEAGGVTGWNPAGPNSSGHALNQSSHREAMMDQELMDSITSYTRTSARLSERNVELENRLSSESANIDLNSNQIANGPFIQNSSSDDTSQNAHISACFVRNVDHVTEAGVSHHPYKPGGSEIGQIPSASGFADPCATTSGTAEHRVDDSDGRPGCSVDSQRLSCKRKAIEGVSGCSFGGSSNCLQQAEGNAWHAVPGRPNTSGSLSISGPVEQISSANPQDELLNPQLDGMRVPPDCYATLTGNGSVENSQRNFRRRINPANQVFAQPNLWHSGNTTRHSLARPPHHSSPRLPISSQSLDLSQATGTATSPQTPSPALHFPGLPHNINPFPWGGPPNSRVGSSSNSPLTLGERSSISREEANSRSIPRSISEHPMFVPATEMRHLTQDPVNWSLTNGSVSLPGTPSVPGSASSRTGSSSVAHPVPVPSWVSQQHPPTRYLRRPSEVARRSLFSPAGSESGSSSNNFPTSRTAPASSQEMVLPPEVGHRGYLRSAFRMDRLGDGAFGVPLSLRALTSASEGRSRLASELRNVLELMRRGENLRFEDVVVLDQSVIFGVPDLQDRHRDMRLDVDNMSYEELLALEEQIGNVSTGLIEETILKCLKQRKYASSATGAGAEVEPCCICQEEYMEGEVLGTLDCGHDFHTDCVKQWLKLKNLCPICKTTALVT